MRRWQWKIQRDTNYYFGLFLLVVASASLIWAIWKDAFEPHDFLVYFLVYAWGYILLLKSDAEYRFTRLEKKMTEVLARLDALEDQSERKELPPSGELFAGPGGPSGDLSGDGSGSSGGETGGSPGVFSASDFTGSPGDSPAGGASGSPGDSSTDSSSGEPVPPENGV